MSEAPLAAYGGIDNLEIMAEAVNYTRFLEGLVAAQLRPGDDIVDFGAGTGTLAVPLAAAGHRIVCIEPDARLRGGLAAAGLTVHASLDAIAPRSLDVAYAVNVLEHIGDDVGAVAGLRERLKPGGRLLVYVPAFACLYSSMDRKVGHVRRYRRGELISVLHRAGLRVERVAYQDCLGFFASLMFRLIGSADGTINRTALIAYDRLAFPLSRRLDRLAGPWFGKNLLASARREDE
jgi:SAM-dependent methyltransferase